MTISKPLPLINVQTHHNAAAYDAWSRSKVQEALNDPRPAVPHETVGAHFAARRAAARRKVQKSL